MKLEHGKTYITVGGWVVEIIEHGGLLFASERTSPGLLGGKTVAEFTQSGSSGLGWRYYDDGVIMSYGSSHSIGNELRIIAEYPNKLADPPKGYTWKGGFPKLETLIAEKMYVDILNNSALKYSGPYGIINVPNLGNQRIALEEVVATPTQEVWPKYYVRSNGAKFIHDAVVIHRSSKTNAALVKFGGSIISQIFWDNSRDSYVSNGDWVEISASDAYVRINGCEPTKKEEAVATQPVWPKYYVNKNVPKNWGVVRYENRQCNFIKMDNGEIKNGPFDWNHDSEVKREVWKQVTKEELAARFDKNPFIESSPQPEYSVASSPEPAPTEQYYIYTKIPSANRYFVKRNNEWFNYNSHRKEEVFDASPESFWQGYIAEGTIKPCTKEEAMARLTGVRPQLVVADSFDVHPFLSVPKEKKMKSFVFVSAVKSIVSRTLGAANYLYVEPTKIIGGYVKRSLRYAVFFGTISAVVYGVNDPAALKSRIASVIPKITIEAPSALK